eukprot:CAMPEP_0179845052 /NCGR_PEP_ID=MMETSP0982-20121206/4699_1 /TAXON_ID=483367 /ORGANISM="non described non described, Strain CCMP 2436" /LENGTH=45 /DNA_ID= /DNA_START= /DNA_END= /DNA_ORIENTATION=
MPPAARVRVDANVWVDGWGSASVTQAAAILVTAAISEASVAVKAA